MFGYKDKIEQLRSMVGYGSNPHEFFQISRLEHEIEELNFEAKAKEKVMENLNESYDMLKNEYEALKELHNNNEQQVLNEVEAAKKKSKILTTYMEVFYTNEFPINKLKSDCELHCKQFWEKLNSFNVKAQQLSSDLTNLKELHNNHLSLQQKINETMSIN